MKEIRETSQSPEIHSKAPGSKNGDALDNHSFIPLSDLCKKKKKNYRCFETTNFASNSLVILSDDCYLCMVIISSLIFQVS